MRRIFVPLHGPDDARLLLSLAGGLASPFGAQIEAALIREAASFDEDPRDGDRPETAATRDLFDRWLLGLASAQTPIHAAWREIPDGAVYAGATLGRASDLIITRALGRVVEEERVLHPGRGERSFRDAILASGRLTLLAPTCAIDPGRLLDRVVVAWDGSAGAAHALGQSLALLERARSVRVITIGRNTVGIRAQEAIASYVALYNPDTRLLVQENNHRQTGRALLGAMRDEGSTLVVMGVSGRSHPAGTAGSLGGTILKIIEDGQVPILTVA